MKFPGHSGDSLTVGHRQMSLPEILAHPSAIPGKLAMDEWTTNPGALVPLVHLTLKAVGSLALT